MFRAKAMTGPRVGIARDDAKTHWPGPGHPQEARPAGALSRSVPLCLTFHYSIFSSRAFAHTHLLEPRLPKNGTKHLNHETRGKVEKKSKTDKDETERTSACCVLCPLLAQCLYTALRAAEMLANGLADAVHVQAQLRQQFAALAVLDEAVGQCPGGRRCGHPGRPRWPPPASATAEAAFQRAFLHRHDQRQFLDGSQQRLSSSGLAKRALMTPTSSPSSRSVSAALTQVGNSVP